MTKRLQVLLHEDEFAEIQEAARRSRATVSDWVRQALREARRVRPGESVADKLEAIARAAQCRHPSPDISQMLEEIERGYGV